MSVDGIFDPQNYNQYIQKEKKTQKGWRETTTEQAVKYYANTIGKVYERFGKDASRSDFEVFREEEVTRIYHSNFQHPCKDGAVIKRRRENIYNSLNERFRRASIVQKFLLDHHPEMDWPSVPIPVAPRYSTPSNENIKTITYEQYVKMHVFLWRLCVARVPHAYASTGEVTQGMRVGESCAPLVGDFDVRAGYGRYYVGWQVDSNGNRTDVLKNDASYRYTFFGQFVCDIIALRKKQLREDGFTDEEADLLPFASSAEAPHQFLKKAKVSAFLRELLVLSGCDEKWLEQQADKIFAAAAVAGNRDDTDIGAHELRSTYATLTANGGIDADTVDALLGHVNKRNAKKDYASWETAEEICQKLERCIYLGSLCGTRNPAITPVEIKPEEGYKLRGNTTYRFVASADMYLAFDIVALEGCDEINVQLPAASECVLLRRTPQDTLESKRSRPILPELPDPDVIEKWIKEAYEIDLTDIIRRYGGVFDANYR